MFTRVCQVIKSFTSHSARRLAVIFAFSALSQTPVYTARLRIRAGASGGVGRVLVYASAFAWTYCPLHVGMSRLCGSVWFGYLP